MAIIANKPTVEPVTLEEAKLHLRVDTDADDVLIKSLISVAREYCESFTGRFYVERAVTLTLDKWPSGRAIVLPYPPVSAVGLVGYTDADGAAQVLTDGVDYIVDAVSNKVVLRSGKSWPTGKLYESSPIQVVYTAGYPQDTSLIVTAEDVGTGDGTTTTFQLAKYPIASITEIRVDGVAVTSYTLNKETGEIVFTTPPGAVGIEADYVPAEVFTVSIPEHIKAAMKLCVGAWYENRENVLPAGNVGKTLPMGAESLLWQNRAFWTEDYNK